ncbi:hypothetical protein TNCV_91951 [Trichonephila clavipes]|nr:hypothetical protein TNCV_91951 [Trichonephila clavipes]
MFSVQSGGSLWLLPARKTGYYGAEKISHVPYENVGVSFSEISLNAPNKVILIKSTPEEKYSSLSSFLSNKNRQIWWKRNPCVRWHNVKQPYTTARFRCGYCQLTAQ